MAKLAFSETASGSNVSRTKALHVTPCTECNVLLQIEFLPGKEQSSF